MVNPGSGKQKRPRSRASENAKSCKKPSATPTAKARGSKARSGSSSTGLLAHLKKGVPPRRTKAAPSKKELRQSIQGKDEATRAGKRTALAEKEVILSRGSGQTLLEAAAVAPRTGEEYLHKLRLFQSYCRVQKLKLQKPSDIDYALTQFLNQSFLEGWSIAEGNKCLAAVMDWRPDLSKLQLPRSRRSLQGWKNLDPGATRPPVPWPLIALITLVMLETGCLMEAMAVLLMFVTYARPGEIFTIRRKDLVGSRALGLDWAVNLHPAENLEESKVGVTNETILLNSQEIPWLGPVLGCLSHLPEGPLIPSSYQNVQHAWMTAQQKLGLKDKAVLHQLRHSGASWDRYRNYRDTLEVKLRGRWQADSSVRRYEQHALVAQYFEKLPRSIKSRALAAPKILRAKALGLCGLSM